ncbi:hypothetical protein KKC83_06840 [Patescibacteria group bacterium]|nr:hypothetical protein [Desulfocapsa sp.]MBU3983273.1 hypothetical protein [Pseudomonadota bacterium]MBU4027230.1 hypothetical protein [Patescibacteria group bacterium]MCG2743204.1 hypothetical protein [Desulfobacteraceae bacterium]MBU4396216.1 hypothetical protein [Pseudomonadota bacterium]
MAQQSFAKTVSDTLQAAAQSGGGEADANKLSCLLHLQTRKDHKRLLNTLSDLARSGKIVRVRQGVYAPAPIAGQPDKREIMWRLLKMRRRVTVDDLVEMADVSHAYANEWLRLLVKREVVRMVHLLDGSGGWVLINNCAEMPQDSDKAERLRNLRLKKKKALARLDSISTALGEVRQLLQTMEEK